MGTLTPSSAGCLPNRLATPSTSTAYVSVITRRPLRSHTAQPEMGELQHDLFTRGNVDHALAHDGRRHQVKHHAAHQALNREQRMYGSQPSRCHLARQILRERSEGD